MMMISPRMLRWLVGVVYCAGVYGGGGGEDRVLGGCGVGKYEYPSAEFYDCCNPTCYSYETCIVRGDMSSECVTMSLLIALFLPKSDGHSSFEGSCVDPYVWSNGACHLSNDWKAIAAMAALAVQHFNDGIFDFLPDAEDAGLCEDISAKLFRVVDSKSGVDLLESIKAAKIQDCHFGIGPTERQSLLTTSVVADGLALRTPINSLIPVSLAESKNIKYENIISLTPPSDHVAKVVCLHLQSLEYSVVVVLFRGRSERQKLAEYDRACTVLGIRLKLFDFEVSHDEATLRQRLSNMNKSDVNVVLYLGDVEGVVPVNILKTAFDLHLLRQKTLWLFPDSRIIPAFAGLPEGAQVLLHGSHVVEYTWGNTELYERFLDSWATFDSAAANALLPDEFHIPDDFFETFHPGKSPHTRNVGTLVYDTILLHAYHACNQSVSKSEIRKPPSWLVSNPLYKEFENVDIQGMSGRITFGESLVRSAETATLQVLNIVRGDSGDFATVATATYSWEGSNLVKIPDVAELYNGGSRTPPPNFVLKERPKELLKIGFINPFLGCDGCANQDNSLLGAALLGAYVFNSRGYAVGIGSNCNKQISLVSPTDEGVGGVLELIQDKEVDVLVGPISEAATIRTALISSAYKVPHLSYSSRSTLLESDVYEPFLRLVPSFPTVASSVCKLWTQHGYKVAMVFLPQGEFGAARRKSLLNSCPGITLTVFSYNPSFNTVNQSKLERALAVEINVVLFIGTGENSKREQQTFYAFMERAMTIGLLSSSSTWTFVDSYMYSWFNEASDINLKRLLSGSFLAEYKPSNFQFHEEVVSTQSTLNLSEYANEYYNQDVQLPAVAELFQGSWFNSTGAFVHDTVLSAGLISCAISPTLPIDSAEFRARFLASATNLSQDSLGLSGAIGFSSKGSRTDTTVAVAIRNVLVNEESGKFYKKETWSYTELTKNLKPIAAPLYNGGNTESPSDIPQRPENVFKVALLQRLTDSSVEYEEDCKAPKAWKGNRCFQSLDWQAISATGLLAVKHFNEKNAQYMKSFHGATFCDKVMKVSVYDSGGSALTSIRAMMKMQADDIDVVIGPFGDSLALSTAMFGAKFDLAQISYGASTIALNNQEIYKYFLRTTVTDAIRSSALCAYWKQSNYTHVAVLHEYSEYSRSFTADLLSRCGGDVNLKMIEPHYMSSERAVDEIGELNIVLCIFRENPTVVDIVSKAYEGGKIGVGKMWFFSDESSFRILQKRITKLEIFDVLKGSFYFKQANEAASYHEKMQQFLSDWDSFELGRDLTNLLPEQIQPAEDIFERYKSHDPTLKFVLERGGYLYDAVAAAGLIACREFPSLRINRSSFAPRFLNGSLGLKLAGLTGDLEFTENGNRKESTGRLQMLNLETISGWGYSFQPVGIFHIETSEFDFQCTVCKPPVYNGGRVEKPVNIESPVENMNYDSALGIVTFLMFVANCIPAASAFIFCRVHRDHPVVKAAQPLFMNVICLGAIISSFSLIPLAFTDQAGPKANGSGGNAFASSGCGLSWWLYCIGFMFTFTPLFLKMNRAYNILYDTSYRSHKITDRSMVISILLFTSVDVIFLTAWGVYDPMVYVRKVTYNEYSQPVNSVGACASETSAYFIGVILFYHVSILAYTSFIAYKASNVNTAFSEAKYITISIYSSLQLLVLGLPLAVIVMDIPNLSVYVRLGIVFLNDFSVQVAIFGPKLYFYKYGASMDGVGGDMVAVSYERQKRIEAKKKSSGASSSAKTSSE